MSRIAVAALAAVLAVAGAGCVATTPEPVQPPASGPGRASGPSAIPTLKVTPTTVPITTVDATDSGSSGLPAGPVVTAPPITAEACELERQPGPADVAPTEGDLTDWSHTFGGRARFCTGGAAPVEIEGRAWCYWSGAFDLVNRVSLLPRPAGAGPGVLDAAVSFEPPATVVSRTAPNGEVASWEGGLARADVRVGDRRRRGIVRLEVAALQPDPEHPVAALPPNVVGLLRWSCLEPVGP